MPADQALGVPPKVFSKLFVGPAPAVWRRPTSFSMAKILLVGPGGGGGGGASNASGGGGGGGSGSISSVVIESAYLLGDLYLNLPAGGAGNVGGGGAGSAAASDAYIAYQPGATASISTLLRATLGPAGLYYGTAGSTGAAAAAANISACIGVGQYSFLPGIGGAAQGANMSFSGGNVTGGGGGYSGSSAGGLVGAGIIPSLSASSFGVGTNGLWLPKYMISSGGTGGGSASYCGSGGNGGPGSGGGGSGMNNGGSYNGGNGGPAFCLITWW